MADDRESTLGEDSSGPEGPGRSWLIYVGSAENQFEGAGAAWEIGPVQTIVFERGSRWPIVAKTKGSEMRVGIPLGWVSQGHAEVVVTRPAPNLGLELRDLGSRNGTHLDGRPIPGVVRLRPGRVFEVGRSFWVVRQVVDPDIEAGPREFSGLWTSNHRLAAIYRRLEALAGSRVPLLLTGETGVGKRTVAEGVHERSGRTGPFVAVNLSAIEPHRVLSTLLGPGGQSGDHRAGLLGQAQGGTVYLSELGELSAAAQGALHTALATVSNDRPGEGESLDVRLIASTTHDLRGLERDERFRSDLYAQLAGFEAELPPLRRRREDLGHLARALCQTRSGAMTVDMATRAFRRVIAHRWPFNTRELVQTLLTSSILAGTGGEITAEIIKEIVARRADMPQNPENVQELRTRLVTELARHGGNTSRVAEALQQETTDIHRWLERFELRPDAYRPN